MREIKFRAWDGKKMIYPEQLIFTDTNASLGYFDDSGCPKIISYPLMQYTGLLDKNEVEIYEGDWVSFTVFDMFDHDTQYTGCIVYCGSRFLIWNKPDDEFFGNDGGFDLDWVISQDEEFEIIGNIHENPELLDN